MGNCCPPRTVTAACNKRQTGESSQQRAENGHSSVQHKRPLCMVFVDLTKAFDYVSCSGLFHVLQRLDCPATLLAILQGFHDGMRATVQFNGSHSNEFDVCCGVKQGCVLAPTLFSIYFSAVLRRAFPDPGGVLLHTRIYTSSAWLV